MEGTRQEGAEMAAPLMPKVEARVVEGPAGLHVRAAKVATGGARPRPAATEVSAAASQGHMASEPHHPAAAAAADAVALPEALMGRAGEMAPQPKRMDQAAAAGPANSHARTHAQEVRSF